MREKRFGFIFWLAFFISNCFFWSEAEEDGKSRQTFVIRYKDEDQTIPVTVVLDYKKQTEYVINMNPRTPAKSVTLYDFKQRTIAYKDLTNRECFLGRLTHETLSEESNALQDVRNPVEVKPKLRSLDPRIPALTPTEIRNIAGQKTAAFCRKMNTWLLIPEKAHSINKREVDEDEFEEHTLQYHGHRSSQYSHYERQTKRRFRNRGHANHKRRSRTKEGVAEKENGRFSVSGHNNIHHHFTELSTDIPVFNGAPGASKQNYSNDYGIPESHFPFVQNENKSFNSKDSPVEAIPGEPATHQDHFRYRNSEDRHPSSDGISGYPKRHYLNSEAGDNGVSFIPNEVMWSSHKNISEPFSSQLARLRSDDSDTEIKSATTNSPEFLNQLRTDYPNVHSSLLHLLPLYKPLGREFDLAETTGIENRSHNQTISDKRESLESEAHDSLNHLVQPVNRFIHLTDMNNTSHDPDVSVNVLEVPRITKEFENIQNNSRYGKTPQLENSKRLSDSLYIPLSPTQLHSGNSTIIRGNSVIETQLGHIPRNDRRIIPLNRNRNHLSRSETFITTELPVLTTREYFISERTTPDTSYVPSVHTAFRNLDDFNSFQIFPNYIENDVAPIPTEKSSNTRTYHPDKAINSNAAEVPQDLISTTDHPFFEETDNANSNQRSDIPSEDSNDKSLTNSLQESKAQKKSFPFDTINKTEDISPHKIRYQNALRDFKPDEIVIDIENIPTHTPPPVTASFHQRVLATIQPTIKVALPLGDIRSDTARRAEQTSVTSWRSFIPTTRFPRRRVNGNSRIPVQSNSIPFGHRNSENRNKLSAPHLNQLTGMRQFNFGHQTNRRQFHYPSHPIASSSVHMPSGMNQIHHVSHLNSLPPGVSVHPRHPQAPFADMVHSNRPPTMPILNDSQEHVKPHRQRHHRKKDRMLHSCCRQRGNPASLQSCCRNGGPCCPRSHRFVRPSNCCSSSKTNIINTQIVPANQVQPHVRTTNKILPSIRTEKTHRSEVDNKDRCQKEKMCRTLYESTQQVMVCRNAHVEGC